MKRGFTVIELLVGIAIFLLVVGAAYVTYISILKGFTRESKSVETQMEIVAGLEIVRLDVEHAGFGIGEDQPDLSVEGSTGGRTLTVRSVLNTTNLIRDTVTGEPVFWALVECASSGSAPTLISGDNISGLPNGTGMVFIGAANKHYIGQTAGTCPDSGTFVAIPYDTSVASGCTTQFCNGITYQLSTSQNLSSCNENTRNLLRAVGSGQGAPILNCVADVRFTFDIDSNGDGSVDVRDGDFSSLDVNGDSVVSPDEVRMYLKSVNVYVLIQEGGFDREFSFNNAVACSGTPYEARLSSDCVRVNSAVELFLPLNYRNYRWKVLKLSVKPMNL